MTTRTLQIPGARAPGGPAWETEIVLTLVDAYRRRVVYADEENTVLIVGNGRHPIGADPVEIELTTTDSLPYPAWWMARIHYGREAPFERFVQLAAGDPITWNQFIADDVSDALWESRLPPSATDEPDNQWLKTEGGKYVLTAAPAGSGDVTGPASSVDQAIALFSGTTGKLLADSAVTISALTAAIITTLETTGRLLPAAANEGDILIRSGGAWVPTNTLPL